MDVICGLCSRIVGHDLTAKMIVQDAFDGDYDRERCFALIADARDFLSGLCNEIEMLQNVRHLRGPSAEPGKNDTRPDLNEFDFRMSRFPAISDYYVNLVDSDGFKGPKTAECIEALIREHIASHGFHLGHSAGLSTAEIANVISRLRDDYEEPSTAVKAHAEARVAPGKNNTGPAEMTFAEAFKAMFKCDVHELSKVELCTREGHAWLCGEERLAKEIRDYCVRKFSNSMDVSRCVNVASDNTGEAA
jgi:hypothetical protein